MNVRITICGGAGVWSFAMHSPEVIRRLLSSYKGTLIHYRSRYTTFEKNYMIHTFPFSSVFFAIEPPERRVYQAYHIMQ